jgi:glycosyltransferase involved in cell wall biosynthesis
MENTPAKRKKVVIVYHFFAHYRGAIIRELLDNSKHDFYFAGDAHDPRNIGVPATKIPNPDRYIQTKCRFIFKVVMVQTGLFKLAMRRDIDSIIYLGDFHYLNTWLTAPLARMMGKKVFFWTNGWLRRETGIVRDLRKTFYKLANGLLLYGNFARQLGLDLGFKPEKLYVVYNSLDLPRHREIRESLTEDQLKAYKVELGLDPALPTAIFVSRLEAKFRLELLFEAAEKLRAEGHPINVLIVGDGTVREALEKDAASRNLPVKFFGKCFDDETLGKLLMLSNVSVAPGQVGLFSMLTISFGTPLITHDNPHAQGPEFEGVVPGVTGSFFKQGDANALAKVLKKWTATPWPTPEHRQACYDRIDQFYSPQNQRLVMERAVDGLLPVEIEKPVIRDFFAKEPVDA